MIGATTIIENTDAAKTAQAKGTLAMLIFLLIPGLISSAKY